MLSRAISFLHHEYEPHMFWWEVIEMLRRFVLVGLMVLMQVAYFGRTMVMKKTALCILLVMG